ncbi:beta-1,4-N-acetylgalactosaminyltransferase 3-like [Megalops cyprinoides]|uniref:beta-1,4-N-acetylgalactosaminyltransferase 3-like n=1 Tax=Megalops cyprinoides TaxID=118141 RepID=UPI001865312D|nr:beta-1,4-N-acetylgalactosaminyltransferase 3-like [Megalops cyprinoides]
MKTSFFPLKKLRRNVKYLFFVAVLMTGVLAAYLQFVATTNTWNDDIQLSPWNEVNPSYRHAAERELPKDSVAVQTQGSPQVSGFRTQPWRPEYKGQANLHIFEDWCGSSTAQLRKNLHYPLYPHSRTTVKKLAVSPRWTNYGLRIFGYLHPHKDGEYVFAVASDDNSELWLSLDDSPLNLQLLAHVGKTGAEWAAPGEFGKYASQMSRPVQLTAAKRYFFEIIHKQNDRGTDHVEVAWRLNLSGTRFSVIQSEYISLYTNESALLMSEVDHIPQTAASHVRTPGESPGAPVGGADMLREDPRDSLHQLPLMDERYLQNILPDCSYKPSYIIKGFPLLRYQGLQFVHMSYVYPNDYTRLTHMETDNKCFYHVNPSYIERFGFYKYMKMDMPEGYEDGRILWDKQEFNFKGKLPPDNYEDIQYEDVLVDDPEAGEAEDENEIQERPNDLPDYGDDYDDYAFKRRRKLFSVPLAKGEALARKAKRRAKVHTQGPEEAPAQGPRPGTKQDPPVKVKKSEKSRKKKVNPNEGSKHSQPELVHQQRNASGSVQIHKQKAVAPIQVARKNSSQSESLLGVDGGKAKAAVPDKHSSVKNQTFRHNTTQPLPPPAAAVRATLQPFPVPHANRLGSRSNMTALRRESKDDAVKSGHRPGNKRKEPGGNEAGEKAEPELDNAIHRALDPPPGRRRKEETGARLTSDLEADIRRLWGLGRGSEVETDDEDGLKDEVTEQAVFDPEVNWGQTFDVDPQDFHTHRSDWIDLRCNVSGNLMLSPADALAVVDGFMKKLNERHPGLFSLLKVVNVEKRVDVSQGSRYLLELELQEKGGRRVRLSRYVYLLHRRSRPRALGLNPPREEMLLCNPLGLSWNPSATVHFIVPVKNQARWVRQFIVDMEELHRNTGDKNFNVIITDYSSTDMDVEQALKDSALPRYEYVKLMGNFERSAGLQTGINLITDDHSIVFLCDLHIHFPMSIIDSIRKHCVEGKIAFAPIVMRLDCGATPQEPKGFWEVNGFGLLGIYKSDLDSAGGMNTKDFRDRWGGEDWELLDRILQAGLEVERIYLRNFLHHYHSKRGMWNRQSLRAT